MVLRGALPLGEVPVLGVSVLEVVPELDGVPVLDGVSKVGASMLDGGSASEGPGYVT